MDSTPQLWLIPLLPMAGFLINGLFGRHFSRKTVAAVGLLFCGASMVWGWRVAAWFLSAPGVYEAHYGSWFAAGSFSVPYGIYFDQLSFLMMLIVTNVGFLIHVYSVGYMWEEGGFYRFFSYLNLFMFFMLTLVLANNYLLMFVGWEGVGLASYLLIGFFFQRDSASAAGKKAFIVNRIGDFGFLIGIFLLIKNFGTVQYSALFPQFQNIPVEAGIGALMSVIGICLLVGATGKSAQLPLYVWLPDAMEGPTPVSALIHAATMVTAGVYMICRSHAIFDRAPSALFVVACIGAATALFAATIGMVQHDIKRVLAYSTVSQLGYMVLACGVAAYSAGMFHLMTHAFFKALLFLAAGSVIHGLGGEQDMRKMGGLRHEMPWTFWTMTMATLAIAGAPGFSGFFSKDEILYRAFTGEHGGWGFWAVGVFTAGLTAFYMFRLWFLTFFGDFRGEVKTAHSHHDEKAGQEAHAHANAHESPKVMLIPLVVLAILSVVGGWVGIPDVFIKGGNHFESFLAPVFELYAPAAHELAAAMPGEGHGPSEIALTLTATGAGLLGFLAAWFLYSKRRDLVPKLRETFHGAYVTLENKYYVDELYAAVIVNPLIGLSRAVLWRFIDARLIDGSINSSARGVRGVGSATRYMQSGNIRSYAGWVALGAGCIVAYMVWLGVR
ncbi:MAG: NADH-quinone oxidoreductase subunit L [Terriglobales bacterium]